MTAKRARSKALQPSTRRVSAARRQSGALVGPNDGDASDRVFADTLVYNTKRSGRFVLGGRAFVLRRVAFPHPAPLEWYVVDLLEHADQAASSREDVGAALGGALRAKRFDVVRLREMAERYGTFATRRIVQQALRELAA